jgi:hypothetical protein
VTVLSKHLKRRGVPHSISHPLYHIGVTRKVQGSIELHDDLIIPRIVEAHDLIDLVTFIDYNDFIEQWMPHISPINALHQNY